MLGGIAGAGVRIGGALQKRDSKLARLAQWQSDHDALAVSVRSELLVTLHNIATDVREIDRKVAFLQGQQDRSERP